jgi:hypothetical protein
MSNDNNNKGGFMKKPEWVQLSFKNEENVLKLTPVPRFECDFLCGVMVHKDGDICESCLGSTEILDSISEIIEDEPLVNFIPSPKLTIVKTEE